MASAAVHGDEPATRVPARRPELSLGDAIRVLRALKLPAALVPELAVMLGLDVSGPALAAPVADDERPVTVAVGDADGGARPGAHRDPPPAALPSAQTPLPENAHAAGRPTELIVDPELRDAGAPPREVRPLEELVGASAGPPTGQPLDLLAPERQRAILGALCASRRSDGEPDVEALVQRIASGEAVATIPRRLVLTTRLGIRLLIDVGTGMTPFREDAARLVARVEQLVGSDGLEHLSFRGSPLGPDGAGVGAVRRWRPYGELRPVPPGRPILVLTDLGLGGRHASPSDAADGWLAFGAVTRAAGSRLVLLVPYPRRRWPAALACALDIVHWDRATSIRDAIDAAAPGPARAGVGR